MKRIGYIYEKIYDKENIRQAIMKASRGKRKRKDVKKVLNDIPKYVNEIQNMLVNETYIPAKYRIDTICEGVNKKERKIFKPNFYPDQIIHWAIYLQVSPILYKGVYKYTIGSIPNRGVHYGKKYVNKWIRKDYKNTKYYLKIDVKKFYPSVKISILEEKLNRKIKDKKTLKLINLILSLCDELPIGMLLSQLFAIFYLQDLDYYIKQDLKLMYYIRYMDDMVVFGRNKKELHKIRVKIAEFLANEKLKLKENWKVCRFDTEGLDFMGFRFFRDKTILRKSIMFRITRKVKKVFKKQTTTAKDASSIISYLGWIKHTNNYGLFIKWIKPYLKIQRLKNIIKINQKERIANEIV